MKKKTIERGKNEDGKRVEGRGRYEFNLAQKKDGEERKKDRDMEKIWSK